MANGDPPALVASVARDAQTFILANGGVLAPRERILDERGMRFGVRENVLNTGRKSPSVSISGPSSSVLLGGGGAVFMPSLCTYILHKRRGLISGD